MMRVTSLRIHRDLYKKICEQDQTGRKTFSGGIFFIVNEYFKQKLEQRLKEN